MNTRKLLLILVIVGTLYTITNAQSSTSTTGRIRNGTSDPATCTPTGNNTFFNTTSGQLKSCTSTDTWTVVGGAGTTGSGTAGKIPIWTAGTVLGDSAISASSGAYTLAATANTVPFTISGYSLTGANASNLLDLSGTWNTSGAPTALKINITNTASGSAKLLDLQIGTNTVMSVDKTGGIIGGRVVTAKTTSYPVVATDVNTFFTNTGAGAGVTFTLPTPVVGMTYEFYRDANQTVTIDIDGAIVIRVGASATTGGGNVTLDAVGSRIRIVAISTTLWVGDISGAATFN